MTRIVRVVAFVVTVVVGEVVLSACSGNCNCLPAYVYTVGRVDGTVVNANGVPMANATVRLGVTSQQTNERGQFVFTSVVTGTYDLVVTTGGAAWPARHIGLSSSEDLHLGELRPTGPLTVVITPLSTPFRGGPVAVTVQGWCQAIAGGMTARISRPGFDETVIMDLGTDGTFSAVLTLPINGTVETRTYTLTVVEVPTALSQMAGITVGGIDVPTAGLEEPPVPNIRSWASRSRD